MSGGEYSRHQPRPLPKRALTPSLELSSIKTGTCCMRLAPTGTRIVLWYFSTSSERERFISLQMYQKNRSTGKPCFTDCSITYAMRDEASWTETGYGCSHVPSVVRHPVTGQQYEQAQMADVATCTGVWYVCTTGC